MPQLREAFGEIAQIPTWFDSHIILASCLNDTCATLGPLYHVCYYISPAKNLIAGIFKCNTKTISLVLQICKLAIYNLHLFRIRKIKAIKVGSLFSYILSTIVPVAYIQSFNSHSL